MRHQGDLWALVLAAGEGSQIRDRTLDSRGEPAPRQFCALGGSESLLRRTLGRAERLTSPGHIITVVADHHRRWWEPELAGLPAENVVVQPCHRGTAVGILVALLRILRRDFRARVLIFPAGHHVADEDTLHRALIEAARVTRQDSGRALLFGMEPDEPDPECGWILPASLGGDPIREVSALVDTPELGTARHLMQQGGLLFSCMVLAHGSTLLNLYERAAPWLLDAFQMLPHDAAAQQADLPMIYQTLPRCDFKREVLALVPGHLLVAPVPPCGWNDLGTPAHLDRFRAA